MGFADCHLASEKSDNSAAYESSLNGTIGFERGAHNAVAVNTR